MIDSYPAPGPKRRLLPLLFSAIAMLTAAVAVLSMTVGGPGIDSAPRAVAAVAVRATLAGCGNQAVDAPLSVPLWCTSTDQVLDDLTWASWGKTSASATGQFLDNACDCSGGRVDRYPVAAELSDSVDVSGVPRYERLSITFPATRPGWATRQTTEFLWSDQGFVTEQVTG